MLIEQYQIILKIVPDCITTVGHFHPFWEFQTNGMRVRVVTKAVKLQYLGRCLHSDLIDDQKIFEVFLIFFYVWSFKWLWCLVSETLGNLNSELSSSYVTATGERQEFQEIHYKYCDTSQKANLIKIGCLFAFFNPTNR